MKPRQLVKGLALALALALCLPVALAEELGELDLYDPAIYVGDGLPMPAEEAPEEPAQEPTAEAERALEPAEEAAPAPEAAPEAAAEGADPAGEAMPEPASQPEAEPQPEPAAEPSTEPEAEPSTEPEAEPADEPALALEGEPAPEAETEPAIEAEAEPAVEPEAEPELEPLLADEGAQIAAPVADLTLGLGETVPLDGAAILGGATPESILSDHPEIVSVDPATGMITGAGLGTAVIAVTGGGTTVNYNVAVLSAPSALLFPSQALVLGKGEGRPFAAAIPEGAGAARIAYASSKPKVLTVDAAGNLSAKRTGTATITATAFNGAQAVCTVQVLKAPSKVQFAYKTGVMSIGESRTLAVTLPKKSASLIAWKSDNPGVLSVDASGMLTALAAGTATVTATSFNNKRASCKVTVLNGTVPTALSLNAEAVALGKKETFQLVPALGEGEAAAFTYSTSSKKIATVSAAGLVTGKKAGTTTITVKTQNGLSASVKVTVYSAPKKITLSPSGLALTVGQTGQLTAALTAGTASAIRWESSDATVASVDGSGLVTGLRAGTAVIRATTFNKKSAICKVIVSDVADVVLPDADTSADTDVSASRMVANLKKSSVLGGKRDAIVNVVQLLIANGFEPAFAAGVAANVYSEGTYGLFESSKYISNYQKRPKYFCYLDGGDYYTQVDGEYKLTAVYLSQEDYDAYTGEAEKRLRFGEENFYRDNYSGKYVQNVDLAQLEALMETLAEGKWQGKFGLGIVQWTGARTKTLVAMYRKHAGSDGKLTAAQVAAAENEMILYDLKGSYAGVYSAWKNANSNRATADAARSAGSLVCTKYEIPVNKEAKAVTRGNKAAEIYNAMMGN